MPSRVYRGDGRRLCDASGPFKSHPCIQKKKQMHRICFFFCYGVLCSSTTDVGGRGLGARVLAVRDETRVTREKIRSRRLALPRTSCLRLYFRVGLSNPTPASILCILNRCQMPKAPSEWDLNLNNRLFRGDFTIFNRTIPFFKTLHQKWYNECCIM